MTDSNTKHLQLLGKQVSFTSERIVNLDNESLTFTNNYSGTVTHILLSLTSSPQISIDESDFFELDQLINNLTGGSSSQSQSTKNPYQVLGCNESDDFSVIKQAYRRLVKQHHPDYMHSKGVDDSEMRKATEKMQDINNAYEEIKKRRNI